jgi:hypothetical protein
MKLCGIVGFIFYILLCTILSFASAYKIITDAASSNVPTVVGDCTDAQDVAAWNVIKGASMNTDMADCAGLGTDVKCTSIFSLNMPCVNKCMVDKWDFTAGCSPAFGNLTNCGF